MVDYLNERPIHIIGGNIMGTTSDTSESIARSLDARISDKGGISYLHLTKDLGSTSHVQAFIEQLVVAPSTQIIFFIPAADTSDNARDIAALQSSIRRERKDLYLVLSSPTYGVSAEEQYFKALDVMKANHANLALAYDEITHKSMVVVPEEAYYGQADNLQETLNWLVRIALARAGESFTRSHIIDAPSVPWDSPQISQNFRDVVNHLVRRGAYKKFRGKTAGHFAIRGQEAGEFLTSRRNHDFNRLSEIGLVRVFTNGSDEVTAWGSKPSVGGQSQRIIFTQRPTLSNIVHFHSPLRIDASDAIPVREQWPFECGSHQCGQNTADGLREVTPGVYAVMLENHGPNILFGNEVPAGQIIDLIERNFALDTKTGYVPDERYQKSVHPVPAPAFNAG